MGVETDTLLNQLCTSGLISQADLQQINTLADGSGAEDRQAIFRQLTGADLLTSFQAEHADLNGCDSLVYGGYVVVDCLEDSPGRQRFRARCIEDGSDVALHVFPLQTGNQLADQQDIAHTAGGGHPHVAPVLATGLCHDQRFVATRLFEGDDLQTVVSQCGTLPLEEAGLCVTQAAKGLAWLYSQDAPLRDFGARNVMLDDGGNARVLSCELYYGQAAALHPSPAPAQSAAELTVASLNKLFLFLVTGKNATTEETTGSSNLHAAIVAHDPTQDTEEARQLTSRLEAELQALFPTTEESATEESVVEEPAVEEPAVEEPAEQRPTPLPSTHATTAPAAPAASTPASRVENVDSPAAATQVMAKQSSNLAFWLLAVAGLTTIVAIVAAILWAF